MPRASLIKVFFSSNEVMWVLIAITLKKCRRELLIQNYTLSDRTKEVILPAVVMRQDSQTLKILICIFWVCIMNWIFIATLTHAHKSWSIFDLRKKSLDIKIPARQMSTLDTRRSKKKLRVDQITLNNDECDHMILHRLNHTGNSDVKSSIILILADGALFSHSWENTNNKRW